MRALDFFNIRRGKTFKCIGSLDINWTDQIKYSGINFNAVKI